jgi:lysophospholipase L1-like esterase
MALTIKPAYATMQIAFRNSAASLGTRSQEDLKYLLILAYFSNRADYVNLFVSPPTLEQLLGTGGGNDNDDYPFLGNVGFSTPMAGVIPTGYVASGFTPTFSAGDLVLNYTLPGSAAVAHLRNNTYVNLSEKNRTTLLFKLLETGNSAQYGIGLSFASLNPNGYAQNRSAYFYLGTGKVGLQANISGADLSTSTSAVSVNVGSEYKLEVERHIHTLTATITNLTTGQTAVSIFKTEPDAAVGAVPNTAKIQISSIGSNVAIHSLDFKVLERSNLGLLCLGDSMTLGSVATKTEYRYAAKIGIPFFKLGAMGNGADGLLELQAGIAQVIALAPKWVSIMMGGNDLLFGIESAVWQAAYNSICTQLRAAGIKILHLLPPPRDAHSVLPLVNFIEATYASVDKIVTGTYYAMRDGTTDKLLDMYAGPDSLPHPNDPGQEKIAELVTDFIIDNIPELLN